eukprot:TRINITY_DN83932_c0_g1_i1.p1 TRINITY_DN83932_c0_g1~~TRINITY_DN83932_c0_g1_i1.p1  ORF type:complete len:153 (-),score=62.19 TRINITY_DN83932_c0_g1_i1:330-788(-)
MSSWQQAIALDLAKGKKRAHNPVVLNRNQEKNIKTGREDADEANWKCGHCNHMNMSSFYRCEKCERLKPEEEQMRKELRARSGEIGKGGGYKEIQSQDDKKQWNSDDEDFDDFGRKKKRKTAASTSTAAAADKHKAALERLKNRSSAAGRRD